MGFFDFLKTKTANVWLDKYTGLIWQLDIASNLMTWNEANEYVNDMNQKKYCGYNDWRLPTIEEQERVHRYKNLDIAWKYNEKGINTNDFARNFFWSSTLLGDRIEKIMNPNVTDYDLQNKAWNININTAGAGYDPLSDKQSVRMVRG